MSHLTSININLQETKYLEEALSKSGFEYEKNENLYVKDFFGNRIKVDFLIRFKGSYDIGFVKNNDNKYEMIADWEAVNFSNEVNPDFIKSSIEKEIEKIENRIKREYARKLVEKEFSEKGFNIVSEEETEDDSIVIKFRRLV